VLLNKENMRAQEFIDTLDLSQSLPAEVGQIFAALSIIPHFVQELAMKTLNQRAELTRIFVNIAPGLGKTKLILAYALSLVETGVPVFILNTNKTLSNRDFQEAVPPLNILKIGCTSTISHNLEVTFTTTVDFIASTKELPAKYHIILDEYQNTFFNKCLFDIIELLQGSVTFTGFSGSPLNQNQVKLLEYCFKNEALVLQFTPSTNFEWKDTLICKT
jgi:superfamily II DNA or RNA helicase